MGKNKADTSISQTQFELFPGSRYMGSKYKILPQIWEVLSELPFDSFLDAFGGSNVVGYFMKTKGKQVISNDFMASSYVTAQALIENDSQKVDEQELEMLFQTKHPNDFIAKNFEGLYFTDAENAFLDRIRGNIDALSHPHKRAIALAALVRACKKKRPRGIFTYTGHRYDDGRKDIRKSLENHFRENIALFNQAVFKGQAPCTAQNTSALELEATADLVYIDPPYYSTRSDNDYVRRYHFVEGLVKYWEGLPIQEHTKTRKFKSYESPFSKRATAYSAFESLIQKFRDSIIVISYSSNSLPDKEEILEILGRTKTKVKVIEIDHTYSFGTHSHKVGDNANQVKEYLFIGI